MVLCTDVICTENTVRRAVRVIAGQEAEPLVIVCAVDTRAERGPVQLLNRAIPVVSLTEVDVGYDRVASEDVTDIDPLTLRAAQPALMTSRSADEHDLLTWFAAPDVLRLGHVAPARQALQRIRPASGYAPVRGGDRSRKLSSQM